MLGGNGVCGWRVIRVVYAAQKICWSIPECEMTKSYDPVTKILHWLIFALIAAQYAVGEFDLTGSFCTKRFERN